jgi:hypothetical protein
LSAAILQTVRSAVEDAGKQSSELLSQSLPGDLRTLGETDTTMKTFVGSHDADVRVRIEDDDE